MSTNIAPHIEAKICKLLRLATRNPEPEEAANAFARAQEIATMHNLQLDDLVERALAEQAPPPPREVGPIVSRVLDTWDKVVPWRLTIAIAVLGANGCRVCYYSGKGGRLEGRGQEADLATAHYIYSAIVREVAKMADDAVASYAHAHRRGMDESPRVYGRSWRLGCASAIALRLPTQREQFHRTRAELQAGGATTPGSLVHLDQTQTYLNDLEAALKRQYKAEGIRSGSTFSAVTSGSGFASGREAGGRISVGGGGRALGAAS